MKNPPWIVGFAFGLMAACGNESGKNPTPVADVSIAPSPLTGKADPLFGVDGMALNAFGNGSSAARALALQSDGKIVAAGYAFFSAGFQFAVARYNADGSLDGSFGEDGLVHLPVSENNYDFANDVAIQQDGKIVVAGLDRHWSRMAVVRLHPDGSVDSSFGEQGIVLSSSLQGATGLALRSDGKILVTGEVWGTRSVGLGVARLNPDGSFDGTFGVGGVVTTPVGIGYSASIAIVPDGSERIVVAGFSSTATVVRYESEGALDSSFGGTGIVSTSFPSFNDSRCSFALQPDRKVVLVTRGTDRSAMIRLNLDGTPDLSFGDGGTVTTMQGLDPYSAAMVLHPDGTILVAGNDFSISRYGSQGAVDPTFGGPADARITMSYSEVGDMLLQPDGMIVIAGHVGPAFALMRYR